MEINKAGTHAISKLDLRETWAGMQKALAVLLAAGGVYVAADVLPDGAIDNHFIWDTKEWDEFFGRPTFAPSEPSEDPKLPNLDSW